MAEKRDNYKIQLMQAQKHFLTYDQQELIRRCGLRADENYLYTRLLAQVYRISRQTGRMERQQGAQWVDGNGFGEVLTILDWLCDSRKDRYITGRWINIVSHGHYFHSNLQEDEEDSCARLFDAHPDAFVSACEALEGEKLPGADLGYAIELLDGLRIWVQLWHGDEEFPPRLRFLWDENALRYLRYETTWYAVGLLRMRLAEHALDFLAKSAQPGSIL